ncbi:unnamed protein product [Aureobasidium uvarum]|uniref:F-box domain-containing protein n=1 Tax=Aureobasidium uvarum TaxID=2773716 RepID=A0A9N8KNF6_9PEZI|nr:unnamed protein product [Aureobasidium uvarum]
MTGLLRLPPELLSRIVDFIAIGETSEIDPDDDQSLDHDDDDDDRYSTAIDLPSSSLSYQHTMLATMPRPNVFSLRNLRLSSRHFSSVCATHLYRCLRLLPTEQSAAYYNNILATASLSQQVQKVVFQTRMVPAGSTSQWATHEPGPGDDYEDPHPFFLDALEQVGRFSNLTHVEMVFSAECFGPSWDHDDECPETMDFREQVLSAFYAGLNHRKHPASKVYNLSIKNLQNFTPQALIDDGEDKDTGFKADFEQVMSRITHLSLEVATEDDSAAPENTLQIPECHDFFGHELQTYWIAPVAENLVYLKLYASAINIGMFPKCNLPTLPKLRTLILGNMSFTNDDQIDWTLSHGATLEELILDDAIIGVGATFYEESVDIDGRRVVYSPLQNLATRPSYQPTQSPALAKQYWLWPTRWHHIFPRLQQGLPKLRHFAFGHGDWDEHLAYDKAETLTSVLQAARYQYLDRGTGPDNWLRADNEQKTYNDWEEDEDNVVRQPDCDDEDSKALQDLLGSIKTRR